MTINLNNDSTQNAHLLSNNAQSRYYMMQKECSDKSKEIFKRKAYEVKNGKENPNDRTPGAETAQRLEVNESGNSNTLTTVQKDNLVLIKQATKGGYINCEIGGVADLSYPDSATRRGRVIDNGNTSPTITCTDSSVYKIETEYRIRKLTPRECGRLMNVSEEDIDKILSVNSNTQAYKQFGNSIVVRVLEELFKSLFIENHMNTFVEPKSYDIDGQLTIFDL